MLRFWNTFVIVAKHVLVFDILNTFTKKNLIKALQHNPLQFALKACLTCFNKILASLRHNYSDRVVHIANLFHYMLLSYQIKLYKNNLTFLTFFFLSLFLERFSSRAARRQEIIKMTEQLIEAINNGDFEAYT